MNHDQFANSSADRWQHRATVGRWVDEVETIGRTAESGLRLIAAAFIVTGKSAACHQMRGKGFVIAGSGQMKAQETYGTILTGRTGRRIRWLSESEEFRTTNTAK
jgi:hypothetical protein